MTFILKGLEDMKEVMARLVCMIELEWITPDFMVF